MPHGHKPGEELLATVDSLEEAEVLRRSIAMPVPAS
jgi:hypothetical protein